MNTQLIGKIVFVSYAQMDDEIIGIEQPWKHDGDDTELFEVELDNGRKCYCTASQIVFEN